MKKEKDNFIYWVYFNVIDFIWTNKKENKLIFCSYYYLDSQVYLDVKFMDQI